MYELRELKGFEFSIADKEKPKESVEIVNHFYVRNMDLSRDKNPCLSNYKVICSKPSTNEYSYVDKSQPTSTNDNSLLSFDKLQNLLSLKE